MLKRSSPDAASRVAVAPRRCTIAAVAAVAFAALAVFAPSAQADGVTVLRFEPPSFTLFNPCTNENVTISGIALTVIDTTPDNHGLLGHSVDIAARGVGQTTGAEYILVGTNTITVNTSDNGASTETDVTRSRLVIPGPGNDLLFDILFHETFDANGDLVVSFNRLALGVCA